MKEHASNLNVQIKCAESLLYVSTNDIQRKQICDCLGVQALVAMLRNHRNQSNDASVLALQIFSEVCKTSENVACLFESGCVREFATVVKSASSPVNVKLLALEVLNTMASDASSPEQLEQMMREQVCETIINVLKDHSANMQLVMVGFGLLGNLANEQPQNAGQIIKCGAFPIISSLFLDTSLDLEVIEMLIQLLGALAADEDTAAMLIEVCVLSSLGAGSIYLKDALHFD
jgi:uncharacterized protein YejL (UPF0352 family)